MSNFTAARRAKAVRGFLATGVSSIALAFLPAAPTLAQEANSTGEGAAQQQEDSIIVTGSRIRSDGMQAPVPVTVVAADEIETLSPGALISGISQLPQFYGNQTPNSGNFFVRSGYGSLNLRGLGVNRTLTLLNGRRVPSTSAFGGVDINLFPEAMIQSVETTTGGASAAYGSDAVAGVVNFTLDTNYTGLEISAQGGLTDRGDGENYEISAAFGTEWGGGRGHFLVSGEYYNQEGIFSYTGRDWYQAWGTFGSGSEADPYRFVPDTVSANASFDGRISAPGTALHGLAFDRNGNVSPYQPGSESQFPFGIPPARTAGGGNDDLGSEVASLYPDLDRYSLFTYADYELSDDFKVFAQYLHGKTSIWQYNTPRASFGGTPTALTIFQDNAFLPASVRQTMIDNDIASFTLRRMGSLEDIGTMYLDDTTKQHIGVAGFEYDLDTGGFLDGWQVDGFYQYGRSRRNWKQFGLRVDRIFAAVDAVDDGTGNIVCRVSLFGNAFPGCEPINLFGRGNASDAAIDYVTGQEAGEQITTDVYFADDGFASGRSYSYTSSAEKATITTFQQHFAELSAAGDIIDLWAGPLAGAVGGSYRRDEILQLVQDVTNPTANHDSAHPVLCSGEAPGLRGVSVPDCLNTVGQQYSKVSNIKGAATVWEAFGEALLPLVDTDGFSAAVNGAVRWADYSGSGSIWAYKGGVETEIADTVRIRGTYSRDVRAANLSERFDKTGGSATITDPRDIGTAAEGTVYTVTRFSGGNPAVRPEKADTLTVGVVFQPSFIDGLSMSLDYYDIGIKGAISQVGNQEVVNRCFLQNVQEFCDLITLGANDDIVLVGDVFVNVAKADVRGIDFESSFNTSVNLFGGDESIGARFFASWLLERSDTNFNGTKTDLTGQTGATQGSGVYFPYADFKATGSLTYRNGGLSALVQARHTGSGLQDACGVPDRCPTLVYIEDNKVDAVTYIDLRIGYEFDLGGREVEVFGNVTNLGNEGPPITPSYSAFLGYSTQQNSSVYDLLGRRYTFGIKFRM